MPARRGGARRGGPRGRPRGRWSSWGRASWRSLQRSLVDVAGEVRDGFEGPRLGVRDGVVDLDGDLGLHPVAVPGGEETGVRELPLQGLDRVARLPLLDLVLAAVPPGVVHRGGPA